MNIYESMNKAFDTELSKIEGKRQKLTESVEAKKEVEFKPMAIPAAFAKYYRVLQPNEYMDIVGFPYEEMAGSAAEYDVDEMQYIIANDDYQAGLADNGLEVLAIYKDGNNIGIGQEVGGRLYPVDLEEITGSITECVKPIEEEVKADNPLKKLEKKYPELDLNSPEEDNHIKKGDVKPESPLDKLVKKYPELVTESVKGDSVMDKLKRAYPELREESKLHESKDESEDDLWSEVYGELTMDGKQVPAGKTTKFNIGVGYDYRRVHTGDDGEIRVEANTLEELRPAADVAIKHKDEGVTYKMRRGSKHERFKYCIEICIPMEGIAECMETSKMDECADKPVEESVEVKNEDLSPIEKLKKAYPELNI